MTSDEIRKRAKEISSVYMNELLCGELAVLKLAEEILGKPLEPEFDESKVKHGSVWQCGNSIVLLLDKDDDGGGMVGSYINQLGALSGHDFNRSKQEIVQILSGRGYACLGQYDFFAGLPKGGSK